MSGPHPDPLDPMQNLEPPAVTLARTLGCMDTGIAMSTAISLKRIADLLEAQRTDAQTASRLITEAHERAGRR